MPKQPPHQDPEQPEPKQPTEPKVRRSTRKGKGLPPKKFQDEKFLPGSNNKYTKGREIDQWDHDY